MHHTMIQSMRDYEADQQREKHLRRIRLMKRSAGRRLWIRENAISVLGTAGLILVIVYLLGGF